jgi:hypothetical protein
VASQKGAESNVASGMGGVRSGSSDSGNRVTAWAPANAPFNSLYAHR